MKREFLDVLGLDKSVIDVIMSEHGKSVSALKEKIKIRHRIHNTP